MADRAPLDRDLAIMVVTAPIWIAGFTCLVLAGWWADRKAAANG